MCCAALARRRRPGQRFNDGLVNGGVVNGRLDHNSALSEGAVDAAALLHRFEGVPALRSFEAANCLLGRSLAGEQAPPRVRAIQVGPAGVTFWLAGAHADAPNGFVPERGGTAWRVGHETLEGQEETWPYLPVVLPIGDDDEGTWLVPLGPGDVLPLLGESAAALWRSARSAASSWAWADTVCVTEDPHDPAFRSEVAADPQVARHLLYLGDPAALRGGAAARTAVVTTTPVAASDLTVLVDRQGATLHPLGRVVRPHLQSVETARHIDELLAPPGRGRQRPSATPRHLTPGPIPSSAELAPGIIDVRLLTLTPRLDGLVDELPPNRARRAVELVAYLALHHPDVITSDRLRTRVLGRLTPTPHRRRCSTRPTRRGVRWASMDTALPSSPRAPATAGTRCHRS